MWPDRIATFRRLYSLTFLGVFGVLWACLCFPPWAWSDDPVGIEAEFRELSGKKSSATLTGIESTQLTWRKGEESQATSASEVWQVALAAPATRTPRPAFWIYLTNGDRWGVSSISLANEELQFLTPDHDQPLKLGMESVKGIQPIRPGTTWRTDESEWLQLAYRREKSDIVILRNGDHQTGEISAIDDIGLTLTGSLGPKTLEWPVVGGLLLNPELAEMPSLPATGWTVLLGHESWLTVTAVHTSPEGVCQLTTPYQIDWRIPLTGIRWMSHWGPEVIPLSQVPIQSQNHQPLLGETLGVSLDRNVRGLPLRWDITSSKLNPTEIRGPELCPVGIGLTSGMTVQWNLDGNYRKFLCGLCLDATACSQGNAVIAIAVDEQPPQKVTLKAGHPVIFQTNLDLTGAKRLTIQTEYGESADVCDWINVLSPVLVR